MFCWALAGVQDTEKFGWDEKPFWLISFIPVETPRAVYCLQHVWSYIHSLQISDMKAIANKWENSKSLSGFEPKILDRYSLHQLLSKGVDSWKKRVGLKEGIDQENAQSERNSLQNWGLPELKKQQHKTKRTTTELSPWNDQLYKITGEGVGLKPVPKPRPQLEWRGYRTCQCNHNLCFWTKLWRKIENKKKTFGVEVFFNMAVLSWCKDLLGSTLDHSGK